MVLVMFASTPFSQRLQTVVGKQEDVKIPVFRMSIPCTRSCRFYQPISDNLIVEGRGISRGPEDNPSPEEHVGMIGAGEISEDFMKNVNRAISNYEPESQTVSGRSSPDGWITGLNTGNTTERSSILSTVTYDDEFDKEAARTVRRLFEEIDSLLYEPNSTPNGGHKEHIKNECEDWLLQFPHLRLIGQQVFTPLDQGFEVIPQETPRPSTGSVLIDVEQDSQDSFGPGLGIVGKSVKAATVPESQKNHDPEYAHLYEEVFEQDGLYEEYMALDYQMSEEEHRTKHKRRHRYPPLTPMANIKDSVMGSGFDCVWQDSLEWVKRLLSQYTSRVLEEHETEERKNINLVPNSMSKIDQLDQLLNLAPYPNVGGGLMAKQHTYPELKPSSSSSFPSVEQPPMRKKHLEDVLKIESKQLTSRMDRAGLHDSLESRAESVNFRMRPGSVTYPRAGITSATRKTRVKLAPIGSMTDSNRVKTPNWEDDPHSLIGELRGVGLHIPDRSASPPYFLGKIGALPPIPVNLESSESQVSIQNKQKKTHFNSRASSAVHDSKDARLLYKEKPHLSFNADWNRPSTTHTFRSDMMTPFGNPRRSSTPHDINGKRGVSQNSSSFLGITGSSISNPPNTDHGQGDEDDDVGYIIHHSQIAPREGGHLNNPYRKAKFISSLAR